MTTKNYRGFIRVPPIVQGWGGGDDAMYVRMCILCVICLYVYMLQFLCVAVLEYIDVRSYLVLLLVLVFVSSNYTQCDVTLVL